MAKQEAITEKKLLQDLQAGCFKPIYFLTGEENYFIDLISDYMETHIVDESFRDFDQTVVYGRDVDMATVISLAKRYPMMSPIQLVMVKEAQDLGGTHGKEGWDLLASYLQQPSERTILVFCYRYKKFDKRTKVAQAIASTGVFFEHARLYDSQVPMWIASYVNEAGYRITERAAVLVQEALGNDLGKIANELSKVFVSVGKGATINESTVERYIGISKDYNVFELQSAIGRRDVVKCNRIVNHFAANPKTNPIQMVLPQLYSYLLKVMIYLQLPDKSDAPAALKVSPFFVKDYEVAASNYTLGKLALCIGYLHDADLRSKGFHNAGTVTDGELLKELVFKIIH